MEKILNNIKEELKILYPYTEFSEEELDLMANCLVRLYKIGFPKMRS